MASNNKTCPPVVAKTTKKWKWTDEMLKGLLKYIQEFKSLKEFEGVDFEADLIVFYEEIRKVMADNFDDFGPSKVSESPKPVQEMSEKELKEFNDQVKIEKSAIKKGYDRIREKIKVLRQDYRVAVNNGTKSGSGKIIRENWDDLTKIWAGSPATKAIKNGCTTRGINGERTGEIREDEDQELANVFNEMEALKEAESWPYLQSEQQDKNNLNNSESDDSDTHASSNKRALPVNPTPKFVDNKRKKLEKQISAKQRDMVLLDAAKKEIELKTTIAHGLLDSNKSINNAMGQMAESINSLGSGPVQGFSMLAQALSQNQQQQNYPLHGIPFQQMPMTPLPTNHYLDGQFGQERRLSSNQVPVFNPPTDNSDSFKHLN